MAETTTAKHTVTRQCSCGKKDNDIDTCQLCEQYRMQKFSQIDSFFLGAIKMALVEAFFHQQHHYNPNGGTISYGGNAQQLINNLMNTKEFKEMIDEIGQALLVRKDEWHKVAKEKLLPLVEQKGRDMIHSWDLKDAMHTALYQEGLAYAKQIFATDPALKEKIGTAIKAKNYTVTLDVRVNIVEDRPAT